MYAACADDVRARVRRVHDADVTQPEEPDAVVAAVVGFFARHEVASLRLPSRWFGRPHDNWHQLTEATSDGDEVVIRLDNVQVLTLEASRASEDGRVLGIEIRRGAWVWTEYGGSRVHREDLEAGIVEFHAPYAPS
jgi:hypothetical protein